MSSYVPDTSGSVHPWVKNFVVFFLWLPLVTVVVSLGLSASLALIGIGLRIFETGQVPDVTTPFNPTLIAMGLAAFFGALYLLLANVTFGTGNVEATMEQAQEVKEEADDADITE